MGLLRTLFFIVLVYYLMKILGRIFGPALFGYATRKAEKRFNERFGQQQQYSAGPNREGEVTIDKQPEKRSKSSKEVGEYIDFEEID
ncbi:DUF4834 family protein [Leptobacterium flavescens]|uniref:DUF4834 family protein n=1 Tax=Leptobacterium flavescens TaxID=472055 RepID=A0A6P0UMN0_9FLAO|nr:DUF4834 family protein [Leptobacterium flavescens]NER13832.1 DUF4834 family protein [Leptobacterium flavescens]